MAAQAVGLVIVYALGTAACIKLQRVTHNWNGSWQDYLQAGLVGCACQFWWSALVQ